jgi:hypothetical protein
MYKYSTCMYLYLPYGNAALLAHTEIIKLRRKVRGKGWRQGGHVSGIFYLRVIRK